MREPEFMNPTGAPEPPGDSGRIVWGIFVLTAGARERTHGCSPRAIQVDFSVGFFVLLVGEVLSCQRVHPSAPTGVAPEPPGDSGRIAWGVLSADVCACILVETESSTKASLCS